MEPFDRMHLEELKRQAQNYELDEWLAVLQECPINLRLWSINRDVSMVMDLRANHVNATKSVIRKYDNILSEIDDAKKWLGIEDDKEAKNDN